MVLHPFIHPSWSLWLLLAIIVQTQGLHSVSGSSSFVWPVMNCPWCLSCLWCDVLLLLEANAWFLSQLRVSRSLSIYLLQDGQTIIFESPRLHFLHWYSCKPGLRELAFNTWILILNEPFVSSFDTVNPPHRFLPIPISSLLVLNIMIIILFADKRLFFIARDSVTTPYIVRKNCPRTPHRR